jgi:hypothetical protein
MTMPVIRKTIRVDARSPWFSRIAKDDVHPLMDRCANQPTDFNEIGLFSRSIIVAQYQSSN